MVYGEQAALTDVFFKKKKKHNLSAIYWTLVAAIFGGRRLDFQLHVTKSYRSCVEFLQLLH